METYMCIPYGQTKTVYVCITEDTEDLSMHFYSLIDGNTNVDIFQQSQ